MAYARLGHAGPWITSIPTPREANAPGGWQGVISTDHSAFTFVYRTTTNATFTVEYADSLNAPSWTALGPVHGDGLEKTVTHPMGVSRFYRVRKTTP
jgi:hypothetical protein